MRTLRFQAWKMTLRLVVKDSRHAQSDTSAAQTLEAAACFSSVHSTYFFSHALSICTFARGNVLVHAGNDTLHSLPLSCTSVAKGTIRRHVPIPNLYFIAHHPRREIFQAIQNTKRPRRENCVRETPEWRQLEYSPA